MSTTSKKIIIGILANVALCFNAMALTDALKVKILNGAISDETVIRFLPTATLGYDSGSDAYKLFSTSPTVPAIFTNIDPLSHLSINALPTLTSPTDVDVFIHIKVGGTYTLQSIELGAFSSSTRIVLEDKQDGSLYPFKNGSSVTLPMAVNTVSSTSRFVIHFLPCIEITVNGRDTNIYRESISNDPQEEDVAPNLNVFQQDGALVLNLNTNVPSKVKIGVYNTLGQILYTFESNSCEQVSENIPLSISGNYIVYSIVNGNVKSQKINFTK